jgi:hypothetical protein
VADLDPQRAAAVQAALQNYPLEPLPPGFTRRVMGQLPARSPRAAPHFRLDFLDLVLPAFIAGCASTVLALGLWLLVRADPLWLAELQLQVAIIQFRLAAVPSLAPLTWAVVLGSAAVLGAAGLVAWLSAPRVRLARRGG